MLYVCLSIGSMETTHPWLLAGSCLRAATIIIIIIITRVGKPSRTFDLLGSSFLIHAKTTKGVNSTQGKL